MLLWPIPCPLAEFFFFLYTNPHMATMATTEEKATNQAGEAANGAGASNGVMPAGIAQVLKSELSTAEWPKEGSVVEVTLLKKAPRKAYFDMGRFGTGIVFGVEMANAKEALRNMKPGDKMHAKIVVLDGEEGRTELSVSEAGKQKLWQQAKELAEAGEVVKAKIVAANAGGLMASVIGSGADDLKAFLPVSQLSLEHYPKVPDGDRMKITEELKKFVGQEMSVKIIDVNQRTNKIIVSEREVLSANVKELLGAYTIGQVVSCLVSGVADFGVFVRFADNPDIEGMIHISELDYKLIDNPKELVKVNDELQAKIIDIKEGRVFLSLKALKEDPWATIGDRFKAGDTVEGRVYKFNPFGAVIALDENFQGLVHISEFGGQDEMKKAIIVGQSYPFVIDAVKPDEKRIILKVKK
jgi:small subunit ribosomal protein S1